MITREIKLKCKSHGEFTERVFYGEYILLEKNEVGGDVFHCEVMKERQNIEGIPLRFVVCPVCGCMRELEIIKN